MKNQEPSAIWYFAYGSNMQRATFEGRRRMSPLESQWGRLDGYRLCFDLPIGPGERGVANIVRDDAAHVYGVLYLITPDEFDRLDRTEGVGSGAYERKLVSVAVAGGGHVEAAAYESVRRVSGRKPSARYLGLLLEGAREHGLPADYVAALESFELAVDERLADGNR